MPRKKEKNTFSIPRRITKNNFTIVYFKTDKWFVGYVEELRGCWSQGKTYRSMINNIKKAIKLVLSNNREEVYKTLSQDVDIFKEYKRKTIKL